MKTFRYKKLDLAAQQLESAARDAARAQYGSLDFGTEAEKQIWRAVDAQIAVALNLIDEAACNET